MYCCGAGTAADTEMVTKMISSQLKLQQLHSGRTTPVATAATLLKRHLFRYQGHIGAALVLGGMDSFGPHIYSIYPHGSVDKLPYTTMGNFKKFLYLCNRYEIFFTHVSFQFLGSGSLAAMAVFESRWKANMSEAEGKQLVRDAIAAGIFNDLGSGSNVDLCIIKKNSVDYIRTHEEACKKGVRQQKYLYPRGTTEVLSTEIIPVEMEYRRPKEEVEMTSA